MAEISIKRELLILGLAFCNGIWYNKRQDRATETERYMKHVDIYTDGACRGNPGRGGWGAILVYGSKEKELSGGEASTTNNQMELMAAIAAMETLKEPCDITLTSDSKYLTDAINKGWLAAWQKNGWVKADKKPVLNVALWQRLVLQLQRHTVRFVWVHGHRGHVYNERCDRLATAYADRFSEDPHGNTEKGASVD